MNTYYFILGFVSPNDPATHQPQSPDHNLVSHISSYYGLSNSLVLSHIKGNVPHKVTATYRLLQSANNM